MIDKIVHLKSIGRFQNYAANGDVSFRKLTLVYAPNGRGKTTLCAILRSLQTGQKDFITERKTLPGHQFVLTTHSPYLLNLSTEQSKRSAQVNSYRVVYHNGTRIEPQDTEGMWSVLQDIGHRPSDVMHPNGIIWVEGPSDVIYLELWLEKWIKMEKPGANIVRGHHYDILPYGGSSIAHINFGRRSVREKLINLAAIHPNGMILIDKDGGTADGGKWTNKRAVVAAFKERGYITKPRCIEGYLRKHVRDKLKIPRDLRDKWEKVPTARSCKNKFGDKRLTEIVDTKRTAIRDLLRSIYRHIESWSR